MKEYGMKKVAVVGTGSIGSHLIERLRNESVEVCFVRSSKSGNQFPLDRLLDDERPDAVFLAIPTKDSGEVARDYILECVTKGVPIITCEKGSLAYHADALRRYLHLIGYSATVGGGTQMLKYLQDRRLHAGPVEIQAVINGTLNFVFSELQNGRSLDEAYQEALRLGYAEPGAKDPRSLINGELGDVVMKTCVMLNVGFSVEKPITPKGIFFYPVDEGGLEVLATEGADYRFVVSFSNSSVPKRGYHSPIPIFTIENWSGWNVVGGFKQITASQNWLPSGVSNAVHITEGKLGAGGKYTLSGPGAGAEPTTSAMLADFNRLCK